MIFKDWVHMAQRPDARCLPACSHQSELREANSHMTTPLDLFGGGIAAAAAKLKLEALSYSVRNDLDNRVLICTLSLPRHFPLPP